MRLLVFGKTGQVARELADIAAQEGIQAAFLGRDQADLRDPERCAEHIAKTGMDVVINAAAYTNVDKAEEEPGIADLVNAKAPGVMAVAAAVRKIPFLHISTDYVFDGSGTTPWAEGSLPQPQGVYGHSKLAGEIAVAAAEGPHVILRTSWVFSSYGANFVKTMLRLGATRNILNVVDDQRGGPTPARAIAAALITIAKAFHEGNGASGVFHFSGAPAVSWADFAHAIFQGKQQAPKINPIPSRDYPTPANRPANSVLDCRKIASTYGITQPDWPQGLTEVLRRLEESS